MVPVSGSEAIPARDFVRAAIRQPPTINRAGTHVADLFEGADGRYRLAIEDPELGNPRFVYGAVALRWVTDNLLLSYTGGAICVVRADNGEVRGRYRAFPVVGFSQTKELPAFAWIRRDSDGPLRIDVLTGAADIRADEPSGGTCIGYYADKDGELAFAITMEDGVPSLQRYDGDRWRRCPVDLERVNFIGAGDRPGEIIVLGPAQAGKPRVIERLDSVTGRFGEVLHQDDGYDFGRGSIYRSRVMGKVLGLRFTRKEPDTIWLDPSLAAIQAQLERSHPNETVQIVDTDDSERRIVVATSSDVDPGAYYVVDREKNTSRLLRATVPWIDPSRMRPMRRISYIARDGSPIEAYLTLPAGEPQAKPPLVVLPHGGPWTRDWWGFSATTQFFASRGYAVLQPNYRGSAGYDWRFPEGDRWDFTKMHNDVADGVRFLEQSGMVDQSRVAIVGSGFGGYLAIYGAVNEPSLYRCAVTISGIFDWGKLVKESRANLLSDNVAYDTFRKHLGDLGSAAKKYDEISPLRHIDRVRIPVLVCHGVDPIAWRTVTTTPSVEESEQLIAALRENHVPNQELAIGSDHRKISILDGQTEILEGVVAFLGRNLAPVQPAQPGAAAPGSAALK